MREAERAAAGNSGDTLASLLHDLRTPLAAMRTAAEIVARDPLTARQKDALDTLGEAIDALLFMTADLVAPQADHHAQEPAGKAIRAVARLFEFAANAKGLAFLAKIDEGLDARFAGESLALRRVLSVIMENAVKYTAAGTISLTASLVRDGNAEALVLDLSDTGCGISAEDRASIFQAFRRGKPVRTESPATEGSGLGLWNASRLAMLLGGGLELAESGLHGSRFRLTLPLKEMSADARRQSGAPQPAKTESPGPARRRILIVDDNATFRRLAATMIEAFGYETVAAESGRDAVAMARGPQTPIDAILLDIAMPEMDGPATLAALRAEPSSARIPVIAMTAAADPAGKEQEMQGVSALLAKPLEPERLYVALARALD